MNSTTTSERGGGAGFRFLAGQTDGEEEEEEVEVVVVVVDFRVEGLSRHPPRRAQERVAARRRGRFI